MPFRQIAMFLFTKNGSEGTTGSKFFFMSENRHVVVLSSIKFAFEESEYNLKTRFSVPYCGFS